MLPFSFKKFFKTIMKNSLHSTCFLVFDKRELLYCLISYHLPNRVEGTRVVVVKDQYFHLVYPNICIK